VQLVPLDRKVFKVFRVKLELQARLVPQDPLGLLAPLVQLDLKVFKVMLAQLDP
jgi:hypothetical protein